MHLVGFSSLWLSLFWPCSTCTSPPVIDGSQLLGPRSGIQLFFFEAEHLHYHFPLLYHLHSSSRQASSLKNGSFGYYCCCMKLMTNEWGNILLGGAFSLRCSASEHFNNGGTQNRGPAAVPTPESHCFIFTAVSQREGHSWLRRN